MRVAHFVQRYPPALGGSEAYFERLSRFLADTGDNVTVFTTTAIDLEAFWHREGRCLPPGEINQAGVTLRRYPLLHWPGRRYLLKAVSLLPHRGLQALTLPCNPIAPRMWRDAGRPERSFDIVHASAFPYAFPIACGLRLARTLCIPFVVTPFLHLGDPIDSRDRTRRSYTQPALLTLLHAADRVFVQTTIEHDTLLGLGLTAEKLVLQGMGVNFDDCTGGDRDRARRSWGVAADEVLVGHLANKSVEKGTADLLHAAEQLWRQGRRFRLVLAGPEMANFRQAWSSFPLKEQVVRLDVLSDSEKRDFFAGVDLFALPSRSDSFGLVLLEAWANGLPNVAYRAGGVAGLIEHERDGLLVPCGNISALAAALGQLIEDEPMRSRYGATGRQRAVTAFRWDDKLQLVRAVYRQLVGAA